MMDLKNRKISGELLIFLGALFWSAAAPLVKFMSLDSVLITGVRGLITAAALLPFARLSKLRWNRWLVLYIICYSGLSISIICAFKMTSAAIATGMQYTAVVWLFLASLLQRKRPDRRTVFSVLLILAGIVLFMSMGFDGSGMRGILVAFAEGIFFAGMTVTSKYAAPDNPVGQTAVSSLICGVFVFCVMRPEVQTLRTCPAVDWVLLVTLGIVAGVGYLTYNMGTARIASQKALIISLSEMILSPLWTAVFLKEAPGARAVLGVLFILTGMVLYIMKKGGKAAS